MEQDIKHGLYVGSKWISATGAVIGSLFNLYGLIEGDSAVLDISIPLTLLYAGYLGGATIADIVKRHSEEQVMSE